MRFVKKGFSNLLAISELVVNNKQENEL